MRKYKIHVIFILLLIGVSSFVYQKELNWETLQYSLTYDWQFDTKFGTWVKAPTFDPSLKKMEGKEIQIKGYIVPINAYEGKFCVSKNPNSSCFFCGKAEKSTIVVLNLKNKTDFEIDDFVMIKGNLRLNQDTNEFPYNLDNAELAQE